ncbi:hypothetical protein RD792_011052 [Penstemon davidsonii]|uniref:Receptor-like serine/threonine-protein kinase n=1 Tax=Penstemon davidsonii TaxID=160366 RepID=A0ABR0D3Q3_9LAMI|nr:hypothetical protein RD792_011052 [Penstemon davidsonii]
MKFPHGNFFILLCILFSNGVTSILADDISPGSTLYASNPQQSWTSPNRTFSLSFIQESQNTFFAAITYNGIPIWKAGGDPGGAVNSSAALSFLPTGNLQLVSGPTNSLIWQSNTSMLGITSASLNDSGNFILKNGSNFPIWTTFDNPTDTILPDQNFTVGHVLRSGLYSFRLLSSGTIALQWNDSVLYYTSSGINNTNTINLNLTSPSLGLQQVGIFSLFDPFLSSPVLMARSNDYGEVSDDALRFVKLDNDGNLRIYSSNTNNGRGDMVIRWTAVSDQCQVFGYCGNFGICRYDEEVNFNPVCGCPSENFALVDPNDGRKGCTRNVDIRDCPITVVSLSNAMFFTYPPETNSDLFTVSNIACRSNCLADSTCIASTSLADGSGVCYMKRSEFVSGYQSPTLTSTSFVKVCEPALPNSAAHSRNLNEKPDALKIAVVLLSCSLALVILIGGVFWFRYRSKPKYQSVLSQYSFSDYTSGVPVQFSYKELQKATKHFMEKLGEGGFGSVYKGVLSNKMAVAVKRLEGMGQGEKQFRMEVATISSTHHLNLVRLIGFCSEGRHRLLVYELLKNGSLDSFLFTSKESKDKKVLNWEHRYGIALGAAKGITYLHEECRDCILHCDIKPENILLDENHNARISDFGLAKLLNLNDHKQRSLINVRGTRGYLAPEWIANLPVTTRNDVYSFGMVLLEMVSGRRNFEVSFETNHKKLSMWAYDEFEKGNVGRIIDKRLVLNEVDMEQVMRVIEVSFWCIQEHPGRRPTMGKVVQMLEGIADMNKPPSPVAMVEDLAQSAAGISSSIV